MEQLPPWIFPPDNFRPVDVHGAIVAMTAGVERLLLTYESSRSRKTRIAALRFPNESASINDSLRLEGPGVGGFANRTYQFHAGSGNSPFEWPVYIFLPPASTLRVYQTINLNTNSSVVILGWEYDA